MKTRGTTARWTVTCVALLAAVGCAREDRVDHPAGPIDTAIAAAVGHLTQAVQDEPYALAFAYFLERRFGLGAFGDAPERYDALLAAMTEPTDPKGRRGPNPGAVRLFRRLVRPESPFRAEDVAQLDGPLDLTTMYALHCDRVPLPRDYVDTLAAEAGRGGYRLTHVGFALMWLEDNACRPTVEPRTRTKWMTDLAHLIDARPLHEVAFEAAGVLAYLGEAERIPEGYALRVAAAQNPDGGWSPCPEPPCDPPTGLRPETRSSHWHPTLVATWLLLEHRGGPVFDRFVPGTDGRPQAR